MYDTTIATKLIGQLEKFLGRISPHFHKPVARFIGDMMYGIMKEKDVKLLHVVRHAIHFDSIDIEKRHSPVRRTAFLLGMPDP